MAYVFDQDIVSEVWKHLSLSSMTIASTVSKDFYYNYKKLSKNDRICIMYKESKDFNSFITDVVMHICNKYNYKKPRFISNFINYFNRKIVEQKNNNSHLSFADFLNSNEISVLYNILVIITHTFNHNYKKIISEFQKLNYDDIIDARHALSFMTHLTNTKFYKIFGTCYSSKSAMNIRLVCFAHTIILAEKKLYDSHKFRVAFYEKKDLLKEHLRELSPNFPEYFSKELLKIIE
tara:strand:- start:1941 stop:2645 length:705 start_codon:yes stop_codon:yes gene_type:complete